MQNLFVLGHPVAHSKSPAMHNAAYEALGLDWEYGFADCPARDEARAFLGRDDWLALNITMPWKPLALDAAAMRTEEANLAGGANVLVRCADGLRADNTDGKGCVAYLRRCDVEFDGSRAVVCGTGPTSLSIMHAIVQAGARRVSLLGRDAAKADGVLGWYRAHRAEEHPCELSAGSYFSSADDIAAADIILDATPLGMIAGDPAPFDTALLSKGQVVFDVVYGHGTTTLMAAAQRAGCAAFDGAGMLVAQAVETVCDIVDWLDVPASLSDVDLFSIMSQAAGFAAV